MPVTFDATSLKIPNAHGARLILPPYRQWPALLSENCSRAKPHGFTIAGIPVVEYRDMVRASCGASPNQPIVATGHQPDFIHCGVWAKSVMAQRLVRDTSAQGIQFWIDYDQIKQSHLTVPHVVGDHVESADIPWVSIPSPEQYDQAPVLSSPALQNRMTQFQTLYSQFDQSLLPKWFDGLQARTGCTNWVEQHTGAMNEVNRGFGITLDQQMAGRQDYALFFTHLMQDAPRFADIYNSALDSYRRRYEIHSHEHPIPDLQITPERIELPIWIVDGLSRRHRLFVTPDNHRLEIWADDIRVGAMNLRAIQSLRQASTELNSVLAPYILRPRAVTFTLWTRMFLCDFFIHGIGGAQYDQITDDIIRRYFGVEPPAYACASASWWLNLPRFEVTGDDKSQLEQELRTLEHHPEEAIQDTDPNFALVQRKQTLIVESHRLHEQSPDDHARRSEVFAEIHQINQQLSQLIADQRQDCSRRLIELERRLASNRLANSREYFFCLFPPDSLHELQSDLHSS